MGQHLWHTIEEHMRRNRGRFQDRIQQADVARATGLTEQNVSALRKNNRLPYPATLAALRDGLGLPYRRILDAALTDRGWLPEPPAAEDVDTVGAAIADAVLKAVRPAEDEKGQGREQKRDQEA